MLRVNEIFYSIQGESTFAGLPCIFIRLTYCNLRCSYCDTEYAFHEGTDLTVEQIIAEIAQYNCKLVEVTGGEPLVQPECPELITSLHNSGYQVLLETGGSLPIANVDPRTHVIMDLKCPSSNMEKKNLYENISFLRQHDEIKFVIGSEEDYFWAKNLLTKYKISERCTVLFSCVFSKLTPVTLVNWILQDNLPVRFQLQMHKFIWHPEQKGV
ncbi:MAG: radical SAM protein [Ignavibacteria bacterium]|nr:radical SAM protein [Ignavibacteria bacterium]